MTLMSRVKAESKRGKGMDQMSLNTVCSEMRYV